LIAIFVIVILIGVIIAVFRFTGYDETGNDYYADPYAS